MNGSVFRVTHDGMQAFQSIQEYVVSVSTTTDLEMWQELRVDQEWPNILTLRRHDNVLVTSKTKSQSQTERITTIHYNNAKMTGNSI